MSWLEWLVGYPETWQMWLFLIGAFLLTELFVVAFWPKSREVPRSRRRGRWVLNNQAEPHHCRTPNRPKRGTRAWRCACGQLHRAHGVWLPGGMVWSWNPISEDDLSKIEK